MSHPIDGFTGILHPEVRSYLDAFIAEEDRLLTAMEAYGQKRGFPLVGRASGRWLELLTR